MISASAAEERGIKTRVEGGKGGIIDGTINGNIVGNNLYIATRRDRPDYILLLLLPLFMRANINHE